MSADDLALYRRMMAQYEQAAREGRQRYEDADELLDEMDRVYLRLTEDERYQLSVEELR